MRVRRHAGGNTYQLSFEITVFTLLMRFVAILFPIWPSPINPTVVALVDIILAKWGVNFVIRNAIFKYSRDFEVLY